MCREWTRPLTKGLQRKLCTKREDEQPGRGQGLGDLLETVSFMFSDRGPGNELERHLHKPARSPAANHPVVGDPHLWQLFSPLVGKSTHCLDESYLE